MVWVRVVRLRAMSLTAMAVLAACTVVACGGSSSSSSSSSHASGSSASPYRALAIVDMSGPTKAIGAQNILGLKAAAAYWNAHGGIGGRQIKLTFVNDNGDPSTAASVLIKWVSQNGKPDYVWPGSSGVDTIGLTPTLKRLHLLGIGIDEIACHTNASTVCPTRYTLATESKWQAVAAANWLKQRGVKKVGLLIEEDSYSESEIGPLRQALASRGITTATATFAATSVNLEAQVSELKSAGVDALFGAALGGSAGYIASARESLGLVNTLPLLWDPGASSLDLTTLASAKSLANSWEETQRPAVPTIRMPGRTLLLQYAKPFGVVNQPVYIAAQSWDAMVLLHDAAAQAGSTSVDAMVKALDNLQPKYVHDPLFMVNPSVQFNSQSHANILGNAESNPVVKTGPLKDGMVQSPVS
jgi:branched-chain amino acid transport system substrate-binding protein